MTTRCNCPSCTNERIRAFATAQRDAHQARVFSRAYDHVHSAVVTNVPFEPFRNYEPTPAHSQDPYAARVLARTAFAAVALLALFAFGGAGIAHASPPIAGIAVHPNGAPNEPPIQIESCLVKTPLNGAAPALIAAATGYAAFATRTLGQAAALAVGAVGANAAVQPSLAIQITNESGTSADLVRIRVQAPDGSVAYIRDVATFASGVTVTHTFKSGAGLSGAAFFGSGVHADSCSIDWVHFTDNTVWHADTPRSPY